MKLREVRDVHAARLEGLHEAGRFQSARHAVRLLLFLLLDKILGVLNVIMARKRKLAGQFLVMVAMRVTRNLRQRLPRIATREQIENAEVLLRAGRRVEPRHITIVTRERLANAETKIPCPLGVIMPIPDELVVERFVLRIKKLVRRWKHRERTGTAVRDQCAARHSQRFRCHRRVELHALEISARVIPRHRIPVRRGAHEARVVNDRAPIFLRHHYRLDVDERTVAIKREAQVAAESAPRSLGQTHRHAIALVRRLHATFSQHDEKRFVWPRRGLVEKRAPALRILGIATPHREQCHWIQRLHHHRRRLTLRRDAKRLNERFGFIQAEHCHTVLRRRDGPRQPQLRFTLLQDNARVGGTKVEATQRREGETKREAKKERLVHLVWRSFGNSTARGNAE